MQSIVKLAGLVIGAIVWLILLLATNFSVVTVDAGLVGVLGITASSVHHTE